jgi:type I restriction enzyme S subunit
MALSDQTRFSGDAQIDQHHIAQVGEPSAKYLVRASLKQSDVGLIPTDWSLKGLAEIAELDVGLSKPKIIFGKGCPVVTVQDLYAGSIIDTAVLKRVSVTADEIKKYRLTKNDILIGNASVKRDGIGYANRFDGASEDVIFAKYAYRARTFDSVLPQYLHHVLRADFCRQWIVANSQTGTLTNLNKSAAKAIPITVPPTIDEQRAIATALSDVDALIQSTELKLA